MTVATTETMSPTLPEVAANPTADVSSMVERYAADLGHCGKLAEQIVDTPFVPASMWSAPVLGEGGQTPKTWEWDYRRRHPRENDEAYAWRRGNAIATVAATIYTGATLGLSWQAALSGIYVANGRTSLYAEQMRALVLAAGHRLDVIERGTEVCRVTAQRAGRPAQEFTYTIEDARRAGYIKSQQHPKGNDKYNTDPAAMLTARATSIACKVLFPDVIRGMDAREIVHDEPVDVTATAEVRRVQLDTTPAAPPALRGRPAIEAIAPAPVAQPAPVETPVTEPEPTPEPVAAEPEAADASRLWDAINARFRSMPVKGLNGPGQSANRLAVVSHITARTIARGGDLTADVAQLVLDNLAGDAGVDLAHAALNPAPQQAAEPEQGDVEMPDPSDGDDPWAPAS